jgi:hypothetical protein
MNAIILPQQEEERKLVEQCLPGFMFEFLFNSLQQAGYDIRLDLKEYAGKCSVAALVEAQPDPFTVRRLAGRVQKDGYDVLKECGTDEPRFLVGGLARCLTRMVNDGVSMNQDVVIIALGVCAEMDDGVLDWGSKTTVDRVAGRIERNFRHKGYMMVEMVVEPEGEISLDKTK